jgi:apolipoprotein N-acyltransferase
MCIARAVEFRRFLIRSANSGVSMVVTPAGEVRETIALNQTDVLTTDVLKLSGITFYARFGDTPLLAGCALLALAAWLLSRRVPAP